MRLFYIFAILCASALFFTACSKNSQTDDSVAAEPRSLYEQVNVSIPANSVYEYTLNHFATATISSQAKHYTESFAGVHEATGQLRYKYVPTPDYKGVDDVVLSATRTVIEPIKNTPVTEKISLGIKFKVY